MSSSYELHKDNEGAFNFSLKTEDGETILVSNQPDVQLGGIDGKCHWTGQISRFNQNHQHSLIPLFLALT
jgi:hypothetical protein